MITAVRRLVAVAAVLTASSALAAQPPVSVDLVNATANPNLEYFLEVGTVVRDGAPSPDMAVCLTRARITAHGVLPEPSGRLIAFIAADKAEVKAIATASQSCWGPQCTGIRFSVADHNLELDTSPIKRTFSFRATTTR